MRENKASSTAQFVALFRAVLSAPTFKVLNDPYAMSMLDPSYRLLAQGLQHPLSRRAFALGDVLGAGVVSMLAGRTRFFDDVIERAILRGCNQVVLLGAGYDARPLRLASGRVRFFEVDHPATQADKRRKIEALRRPYPATFVTVDFTKDKLQDRLLAAGFHTDEPTFFLWEGVIMYLSEAQVRSTLRALHELAAPGSQLSFDCLRQSVSRLDEAFAQLGKLSFAGAFGEPLDFRSDPAHLKTLLKQEGWSLLETAGVEQLYQRYLSTSPLMKTRDLGFVSLAEHSLS